MNPLISIIIPTKNRQYYCEKSIQHILSLKSTEIHLFIKDNSDNDDLRKYCDEIDDLRLEYFFSTEKLSMAENFQDSLKFIKGDYFMFLGDDDSVNPHIVEFLKVFKNLNADAIVPTFPMYYVYPNHNNQTSGNFNYYVPTGSISKVLTANSISGLLNEGLQDYTYTSLPRPYHGIIKSDVLKRIENSGLVLFGSASPDIYSSIILSHFIESTYHIDYPLSIAGACPQSGSSMGTNNKHCGRLEDAMYFKDKEIVWSERLPRFYSVETTWAFAGIQAFEKLGRYKDLEKFNVYRMTSRAILKNWSIFNLILNEFSVFTNNRVNEKINLLFNFCLEAYLLFVSKADRKLKYLVFKKVSITDGVQNFDEAVEIFEKSVSSQGILKKFNNEWS